MAQEDAIHFREQQLSDNLMSPFCPGRTLSSCPSEQALELRKEIRGRLESGKSEPEIRSELKQRYGEEIFGLGGGSAVRLLTAAPVIFLLLAAVVVIGFLRRSSAAKREVSLENVQKEKMQG